MATSPHAPGDTRCFAPRRHDPEQSPREEAEGSGAGGCGVGQQRGCEVFPAFPLPFVSTELNSFGAGAAFLPGWIAQPTGQEIVLLPARNLHLFAAVFRSKMAFLVKSQILTSPLANSQHPVLAA